MKKTPIPRTRFYHNPYQKEWFYRDYFVSPDGIGEFPNHHCKLTFDTSFPFIEKTRVALDIGCRDGEYARYLQHYFNWTFCFDPRNREPFPYNVDLSKTTHFTCALGDERCDITMYAGTHASETEPPWTVRCLRLDDFNFVNVDYIKIDVEGFEKKVLVGGEQTILRDKPLIVIEQNSQVLDGEEPFAAKRWLEERGYAHVATCPRGWDHIMQYQG